MSQSDYFAKWKSSKSEMLRLEWPENAGLGVRKRGDAGLGLVVA